MAKNDFKKKIHMALNDETLKTALDRAENAYMKARDTAFESIDFESLRNDLKERKNASLADIPSLFAKFKKEAEAVGVTIHQAADAKDARNIILDLARKRNVKNIVKSKSMLTEEIELNPSLIEAGMNVVETDLGEWICQLAGEKPSHFTAPAVHKTREQIAELFSTATGRHIDPDIPALVETARREIRQAFIDADMGISGANIAIADTGTLVIVSNEGNARLVTSLPEIHVAIVGYEKLVPSIDDASAILKLLSKSGTGQKMTAYVSFITGPSRTSDIEKTLTLGCHGPKELHIIFVDNGRLSMFADPDFRDALRCIKCGACLAVCPVYRSVGGHVFGYTYVGGIGAILAAFHAGLDEASDILSICAGCRRCTNYCPSMIDIPSLISKLRHKLIETHGQPLLEKMILKGFLGNPDRFRTAIGLSGKLQHLAGLVKPFLPDVIKNAPSIAAKSLRDSVPAVNPAKGVKRGTLALFAGCAVDYIHPEIGISAIKVLTDAGWDVVVPVGLGCCGLPALSKGDEETARRLAAHNASMIGSIGADKIITVCPTCAVFLKNHMVSLVGSDAASEISDKVVDFSCFLLDEIDSGNIDICRVHDDVPVFYHDSCHGKYGLGILEEPRDLLKMSGYEVRDAPESCCGFAGTFSIAYLEISESIMDRKYDFMLSSDAQSIITDCPGCLIQIRKRLKLSKSKIEASHIAQVIGKIMIPKDS